MESLEALAAKIAEEHQDKIRAANNIAAPDKSRYYELDERPEMAQHLPPSSRYRAYRGRIVPGVVSGDSGARMGQDPEATYDLRVEPGTDNDCVLNLKQYTEEEVSYARQLAAANGVSDPATIGVMACRLLAAMRTRKDKAAARNDVARPIPRKDVAQMPPRSNGLIRELEGAEAPTTRPQAPPPPPARARIKVEIELPGGGGDHIAFYDNVIVRDGLLVLVHDHAGQTAQHVWFPKVSEDLLVGVAGEDIPEESLRAGVRVFGADGNAVAGYLVFPTNKGFVDGTREYAIMTISREIKLQAGNTAGEESGDRGY